MNLTMEEKQAIEDSFLEHSGVKNMKWGQRRYQNPDGSLTALGRIHYGIGQRKAARTAAKKTKVMQSGDIKTVLKYRKKLTDEEFDTAMNRIAKTEALRSKERAEKEAKQRAKLEAKAQKDKTKLRQEELDNAKDIAKIEAKTKVKAAKSGGLIKKGLAIAGSIAGAYGTYKKIANMISDLTGKDLPGVNGTTLFGKKESDDKESDDKESDDKKSDGSGKKGDSTKTSKGGASSTDEPKAKEEPKTESSASSSAGTASAAGSSHDWGDFAKDAADFARGFSKTSTSSSEFKEYVSSGVSVEGKGKSRDKGFFSSDSIFGGDWDDISSTSTSEIDSFLPTEYKKWWLD
jgi:hypothetical protein